MDKNQVLHATCRCGKAGFTLHAAPIASVVCYCDDCQAAGRMMAGLAGATAVLDEDGGSAVVLVRKDRIVVEQGEDHLSEFRLAPGSSTRRLIASCCNTPMLIDVPMAHWVSVFGARLPKDRRPLVDMRVMTRYRTSQLPYPDAASRYQGHTGRFFLKVLGAWARMGFRTPKLPPYPHISV